MPARPTTFKPPAVRQSPLAQVAQRQSPTTAQRGYDAAWKRLRQRYARAHPLCVQCLQLGKRVLMDHVDHIVDIKDRPDLRLDEANLQSLCATHHGRKTRSAQLTAPMRQRIQS